MSTTLSPLRREITLEKMKKHSSSEKNVHTDYEIAREYGYEAPPASGSMFMGYISEWLFNAYGEAWLCNGEISCKFFNIVTPGDTLVVEGKVAQSSKTVEIDLEGYLEDSGESIFVGNASIDGVVRSQ